MIIGVLADTHGSLDLARAALTREKPDFLFFLGDYYADGRELLDCFQLPGVSVMGNGDMLEPEYQSRLQVVMELGGLRFGCTHGHNWQVKNGTGTIRMWAATGLDIILFGHTHQARLEHSDDCWLMNPGSASEPRDYSDPSMGRIEITPGAVNFSIFSLCDGRVIAGDIWLRPHIS
jgi:putative phosphoesterase